MLMDVDGWHLEVARARGHSFCSTRALHPHLSRFRHQTGNSSAKALRRREVIEVPNPSHLREIPATGEAAGQQQRN